MNRFPITGDWYGLYQEKWGNNITPESTSHPAKFARALIRQINKYLLGENLVKPGDTILDPFSGVGLGALDALFNGLSYIGVELERRFVDMGQGCDCTGISKADWVRFYGRWDRVNYRNGRHWCPRCLAEAKRVLPPEVEPKSHQLSFLSDSVPLSAAYVQNSGKIPYTEPHRYKGNLSLFMRHAKGEATAILLQGDSRKLIEVLQQNGIGAVVSSPPYSSSNQSYEEGYKYIQPQGGMAQTSYGNSQGQLANLSTGDLKAVVTSSPFAGNSGGRGEASRNGIDAALFDRHQGGMVRGLGETGGNLGAMQPKQSDLKAIVGSPPYADGEKGHPSLGSVNKDNWGAEGTDIAKRRGGNGRYGDSDGQLGAMKAGEIKGVIGSPPYLPRDDRKKPQDYLEDYDKQRGFKPISTYRNHYSSNPQNLGNPTGINQDTFWSAARLILEQCYLLLPVGGTAVFVCKDFVKNWERAPFSSQWVELCMAVGLEPYAHFRAWQVKPGAVQAALLGEDVDHTKEYKSFFRRNSEKKGAPRIDWEDVLIFRKGESNAS